MDGPDDPRFPDSVLTVAVCGGTFDPPTRAHVELPIAATQAIGAGWLLVIPASASPFKPGGAHASDEQRLRMLGLAFAGRQRVTISSIELDRGGVSYTVDTLSELRRRFPSTAFRLIIGADQAASFHLWREAQAIIELAEPVVVLRGEDTDAESLIGSMALNWSEAQLRRWRGRIVFVGASDASSTQARAILASPNPDEDRLLRLLDPSVLGYIRREGLYGSGDRG
jgi:nicotinate-nucleotide adenylyltransferase